MFVRLSHGVIGGAQAEYRSTKSEITLRAIKDFAG
jgi:hypothetical protein